VDRIQIGALVLAGILFLVSMQLGSGPAGTPSEPETSEAAPTESSESASGAAERPAAGNAESSPSEAQALDAETEAARPEPERQLSELSNDVVRLRVSNEASFVESAELLAYESQIDPSAGPVQLATLPEVGLIQTAVGLGVAGRTPSRFEITAAEARSLRQRYESEGVEVSRELSLDPTGYGGSLRVRIVNRSQRPVQPRIDVMVVGRERELTAPDHFQNAQLVASVDGSLKRSMLSKLEVGGMFSGPKVMRESYPADVEWVGVESQYFLTAVLADAARNFGALEESLGKKQGRVVLSYPAGREAPVVPSGQQIEKVYRLYLGPKLEEAASVVDPRLEPALRVGWSLVRPLVLLFEGALNWIYGSVIANYGVAIILITLVLRTATFPLSQSSMKSMKRMSSVGPEMREIQEKYKDDRERMQQEMMAMYKRTGVNPFSAALGGCLPMLLQMPFMIALYFALQGSIELRHAGFVGWIDDLSAPENFLSVAGVPIRPLPLLMGASMILQQWLTPATGGEQQSQQRTMMMAMSGVFTVMFYQFPSGLVLYWLVSNLLGIGQQLLVNKQPT